MRGEELIFKAGIIFIILILLIPIVFSIYGIYKKDLKSIVRNVIIFALELGILYLMYNTVFLLIGAIVFGGMIFIGLVLITPIVLLIYGLKKKNKKLIRINLLVVIIGILLIGTYIYIFPTHFPYVDRWIEGKNVEEIVEIYGEPYEQLSDLIYYKAGYDSLFGDPYYYCIHLDDDGKAIDFELTLGIKGG